MSTAFQISDEDVLSVLKSMGHERPLEECEELVTKLDAGKIEKAALYGDDLDKQTEYAHEEIRAQLEVMGFGSPAPSKPAA